VVTLQAPPLSARREDIPRLFMHLVGEAATRYKMPMVEVDADTLADIATRDWPGNVRELRNAADRFVLGLSAGTDTDSTVPGSLADQMAAHEKALISATLAANAGSLKQTYEGLGVSRKALYEKMQKHGLDREDFA